MGFLIRRLVFLFTALLLLASCSQGGGKIEANKEQSAQTATISAPIVTNTVPPSPKPVAARKKVSTGKVAFPQGKASSYQKQTGDYNGVTRFSAE